jgi:4a-hydroxytetrahydrobiopterin dehydratase
MKGLIRCYSSLLPLSEIAKIKPSLPGWEFNENKSIHKKFVFKDFKQVWQFMTLVAKPADERDHHPEWKNVYNWIEVKLITHTADGITQSDIWLAKLMDKAEALVKHED